MNNMNKKTSLILFITGIMICLIAATWMFFDILPLSLRIAILILGLGLMTASHFGLLKG